MKFILTWTVKPKNRDESCQRLQAKADKLAIEGIKVLGHWYNVNLLGGWALVEADSEATIAKWLLDWTNLNINDVTLVVEHNELLDIWSRR
ncbi:MAG: DUF3303 family protein [Waddliaceae bacterium]